MSGLLAGLSLVLSGCGEEVAIDHAVRIASVTPTSSPVGQAVALNIRGGGFAAQVRVSYTDGQRNSIDVTYRAWLSEVELAEVIRLSDHAITATAPGTLPLGPHDLRVEGPWGDTDTLAEAVIFTDGITGACVRDGDCRDECHSRARCVRNSCEPRAADLDADGDGHLSPQCYGGDDCNDNDADNWISCDSCVDADVDGLFIGCDAYDTRNGPDCDDADSANTATCP